MVSLQDKLCEGEVVRLKGDKFAMRQNRKLLLPHGVRVTSQKPSESESVDSGSVVEPMKILTARQVQDMLHSEMMCIPVPVGERNTTESVSGDGDGDSSCHDGDSDGHSGDLPDKPKGSGGVDASSRGDKALIMTRDVDRLKSVSLHPSSALSGGALDDVPGGDSVEGWLARLSDACPLESSKGDVWIKRKKEGTRERQHGDDNTSSTNTVAEHKANHCPITPRKGSFKILDSILLQSSSSPLRNISECGGNSELDNVIQRLAMVRKGRSSDVSGKSKMGMAVALHPPSNDKLSLLLLPTK